MSTTTLTNLAGTTSGSYEVTTENSSYIVDFDAKRAKRIPGVTALEMRKDGEWFNFITVVAEVDGVMFLWASDITSDTDVFTNRRTSKVISIKPL